ncbi:calmodulin binding protein PICBP-like [Impatiens glandulifera]|uniref:calmodulin binding protein PICBP-like n=1 Tax=Impatiens glandulifera TaxID=253017 RepID=UPI001FB0B837|nr:calmodulin binding protein PICBP-like [Impatiens glandulifera]
MASSSSSPPLTAIDERRSMDSRKKLKKLKSRKYSGMRLIKPSTRRVNTVLDSPSSYQSNSNSDSTSVNQSPFEFPPASPDFMTVKEGKDEIDEAESGAIKESASSRNYLKATSSSDGKKTRSQARIRNSSNNYDIETKSQTTSSRNFGFLMSKSSFKYRKPATKNVNRNTCSSSLKDCKFPCTIELQTGERESLITPTMKVCPYTYCSLHGHQHKPPLPRFRRALSKNRRTIRSQRSMKFRVQSSFRREQCIDDLLKEIETIGGDPIVQEIVTECSDYSKKEGHGSEVETEEQTDLQADESVVIEEEDDADTMAEPKPKNATITREHEEQPELQADESSVIEEEDDADTIAEPNPKNATITREHEEQTELQADDSSAIEEEDDADTIAEPNPNSEFLSTEMDNAPLHNLQNATKTREHEEQTHLQADDSSAIEEEDDSDTIAEPNTKPEFLSSEMHNAPHHNLQNATKTREHEEQSDLQADDSSVIKEEDDDAYTIAEPNPNSEFLSSEMHNAPLHNLQNATKTREHEEQTDLQADDSSEIEEDDADTIEEPNPKSEFLSTEMYNAPLHNLQNATKTREHEEQADLQVDDSSAIEEKDDTDTIAEPTPKSEFLSTEMYNAPLHNLENTSKSREHEEQTDLQADDSSVIEEENDTDTIAEPNPKSEFLSTEMNNAPLHNLENASKTREHEEQTDLQADDSSAIEEEDDTDTIAEPTPNSEFLSTEMYNVPLHNLENTSKTRQHEDSIEIPCSPNSTDGILKQDCESNQFCPDEDSEQNEKIVVSNTPLSRRNHVSMWRLINRHMVLGLPPSDENPKTESNQTEDREIEVRKIHAVKLVREAIEKILLPEVQDDQSSVCSDITTDQEELLEEKSTLVTSAKGNKSEKKAIKNWSNLKKWVLLKRFIKELEKVKRLNLSRQHSLPLETESDGEKVNLRHQTTDAKKKTEEWMLDYALRKVVSELAPTQQKKVALLVKAFETVGPTPEEALQMTSLSFKYNGERNLNVESSGQQNHQDEAGIISTESATLAKVKIYKSLSDGIKLRTDDSCIASIASSPRSTTTTSLDHERELEEKDGEIMQPGESSLDDVQAERQSPDSSTLREVFNRKLNETNGLGMWRMMHQNMQPGESPQDDAQAESESPDSSTLREVFNRKLNETKGLGMWHLIHQNMVQGLHHKKESSMPEEEDNDNVSRPSSDLSPAGIESDVNSDERLEIEERKINTIKLVREAIENILLPAEFQDHQLLEKKHTEETSDSVLKDNTEEKSGKQALKSWSSLKKMILLKRFIKELAKVKKTIKRGTDDEEGVHHLRRQIKTSDKRNSEEWMLDFALRQVVSELAPVQKRKVALLVKAFETVAPPSEELNLQISASPKNNKPIDTGDDLVSSESGLDHSSFKLIPERSVSQIDNPNHEQQQLTEKKKSQKSDLDLKSKLANEKPMDKRQYISMWHQLCQHVVSSAEEKVEKDDAANDDTNKRELEFKQSDAVRLVKEAIGEIMSQETKDDSSDAQSTCSDDDGFDKQMAQAVKMSKSMGEGLKKWSKVRKLIILKRSIKAMENARKEYSQRPPQFLALKAEIGEEKIDLRQQMIDERKKAEDWMLDYALQNIVNKLNPARKRRVSMLVEAFEAVVPLPAF